MNIKRVDPKAYSSENYGWPGNIRELQNTIERIKILAERNEITLDDIPFNIRMPKNNITNAPDQNSVGISADYSVNLSLDDLERQHIIRFWLSIREIRRAQPRR